MYRAYARLPSGPHAGAKPRMPVERIGPGSVRSPTSIVTSSASAGVSSCEVPPTLQDAAMIFLPSGDQLGSVSWIPAVSVTFTNAPVAGLVTQMS